MAQRSALAADHDGKRQPVAPLTLWPAGGHDGDPLEVAREVREDNGVHAGLQSLFLEAGWLPEGRHPELWTVERSGRRLAHGASLDVGHGAAFAAIEPVADMPGEILLAAMLEALFVRDPELDLIGLAGSQFDRLDLEPRHRSMVQPARSDDGLPPDLPVARRSIFYQTSHLWLQHGPSDRFPPMTVGGPDGRDHPLRALKPEGLVYRRYDPALGQTVSFRTIDAEADLDLFHGWMNDGRVAFAWELAWTREQLGNYLAEQRNDPRIYGLIGCFDDDPAGYFETYWATEDRLGAHYDSHPFDRGWHGLIGNRRHLGSVKTAACLRGLIHYLFLDDVRTTRIVGEPNAGNQKILSYANRLAYQKIKEFDFPHKRAALLHCHRERFFREVRL